MLSIIAFTIIAVAIVGAAFLANFASRSRVIQIGMCALAGGLFLLGLGIGSSVSISDQQVGIITRHLGDELTPGQIIARDPAQKGPQARVLGPGIHFQIWPVFYSVDAVPVTVIQPGHVGVVTARDGRPLPEGQTFAPPWANVTDMINTEKFLEAKNGGFKGPQMTVLPPGNWRVNTALFDVKSMAALVVPAGKVAVIKSNSGPIVPSEKAKEMQLEVVNDVPLVPEGYRGIWNKPYLPGTYYINPLACQPIFVKTTQRTYTYQADTSPDEGSVAATVNHPDRPTAQKVVNKNAPAGQPTGDNTTDYSIIVRSKDGFTFPIDTRIGGFVGASHTPYLVALLGDPDAYVDDKQEDDNLETLEARLILPITRAILRNVGEGMGALEFINSRSKVETTAKTQITTELAKYKFNCDGVFIGNIHLGATEAGRALIKTQTDKEVAVNQETLYKQQQKAEEQRKQLVMAQTQATQQKDLTEAEIDIKIKENRAAAKAKEAQGESDFAKIIGQGRAEGYAAQVNVLGKEQVAQIELMRLAAEKGLQITPQVMVQSGNSNSSGTMDALAGTILRQQVVDKK